MDLGVMDSKQRERLLLMRRVFNHYGYKKEESELTELAKELSDEGLSKLISGIEPSGSIFFHGKHYTLSEGALKLSGSSELVRARVREALRRWKDRAYYMLRAACELRTGFGEKELREKTKELGSPHFQSSLLGWLESFHLLMKLKGNRWAIPEEELAEIMGELRQYEPKLKLRSKVAKREIEEVLRLEEEFDQYVEDMITNRKDETVSFGERFSVSELVEYLQKLFGPVLYYDILLAIVQQYSLADVSVMTELGGARMRTGFNLALFGEPGTGKTFAASTMIMGDPDRGILPHGLPGRNRYCGGMTPAKFIRVGEAYEGRKYNFIVTEFNDWFKYSGMVEPLKVAMEHGRIMWETAHQTIGPYRFTSFLSVNYNTRVRERGYEVTVRDPNFSAIEERMLCRLHRLTKARYREIANKQMELTLGRLRMEAALRLRDHVTLIHAIETDHPAVSEELKFKPVILDEKVFEEVARAREKILDSLGEKGLDFSPRLEARALQLACAISLIRYFQEGGERIEVDPEGLTLAIRFYVEEAAVRSKEEFDPAEVLFDLGIG